MKFTKLLLIIILSAIFANSTMGRFRSYGDIVYSEALTVTVLILIFSILISIFIDKFLLNFINNYDNYAKFFISLSIISTTYFISYNILNQIVSPRIFNFSNLNGEKSKYAQYQDIEVDSININPVRCEIYKRKGLFTNVGIYNIYDYNTIDCEAIVEYVSITKIDVNRGNCNTYLKNMKNFRIVNGSSVYINDGSEFEPITLKFGEKFSRRPRVTDSHQDCNVIEFTITANGRKFTWTKK